MLIQQIDIVYLPLFWFLDTEATLVDSHWGHTGEMDTVTVLAGVALTV